jgi:hypothetical protein
MRNGKSLFWLLSLLLGTALLLPVGLAAQDDTSDQTSIEETAATQADRQQRHREFHQRWRARLKEQRGDVKESRRAYREAVKEPPAELGGRSVWIAAPTSSNRLFPTEQHRLESGGGAASPPALTLWAQCVRRLLFACPRRQPQAKLRAGL